MPPSVKIKDLLEELTALLEALRTIVEVPASSSPTEPEVWAVYARLEKVVALLKFRGTIETPGVFRELPKSTDPRALIAPALKAMSEGETSLRSKNLHEGLESLRVARDHLRAYLSEEKKARARLKRRAAAATGSSS